jgi:hypothetical protein
LPPLYPFLNEKKRERTEIIKKKENFSYHLKVVIQLDMKIQRKMSGILAWMVVEFRALGWS